jgi:capsular exopolysaccharide synthesis family protein
MDTFDSTLPPGNTLNRFHETSARFQRYKVLLRRRWWFLILTAAIAICGTALNISSKKTEYRANGTVIAGMQVKLGDRGSVFENKFIQEFYGTQIEMLQSARIKANALTRLRGSDPGLKEIDVNIRVTQNKGSSILNVVGVGEEPEFTWKYVNALLDEYLAMRKETFDSSVEGTANKIIAEVQRKEQAMVDKKKAYEDFLKNNDQTLFNSSQNQAAVYLASLQHNLRLLETEKSFMTELGQDAYLRQKSQNTVGLPSNTALPAPLPGANPEIGTASGLAASGISRIESDWLESMQLLRSLEAERERLLRGDLLAEHPQVKDLANKIDSQKTRIETLSIQAKEEWARRVASLDLRMKSLKSEIEVWKVNAAAANEKIVEHQHFKSDYDRAVKDYEGWLEKRDELSAAGLTAGEPVTIMDRPGGAVQHDPDLWFPLSIALLIGLVAGGVILLLFDRLDDRMNSFSEFQALFPGESILGQIPEQSSRGDVTLLRPNDDRHLYAESFRNLRSSILFKNWRGAKPPKVILVTSAVPNEGKTTTVANLAVTMAIGGARVLLVDADLRRGGVNELFKISVNPGFSDVLTSKVHWRDAVQDTGTKGLHVLPRGEALEQTSEMFLSPLAGEVVKEMQEEYDYVIFDSAPVLVADDTASFAPRVDSVLFVVRMSSTMARLSAKALDLLYERQVNVGGIILNRSSTNLKEYTYYNYASYYTVGTDKAKQARLGNG